MRDPGIIRPSQYHCTCSYQAIVLNVGQELPKVTNNVDETKAGTILILVNEHNMPVDSKL